MEGIRIDWRDKEVVAEVRAAVDRGAKKGAERIYKDAKNSTEFEDETGTLRKSIKMAKSKFKNGGHVVYADAPHAHLVEYGHEMVVGGTLPGSPGKRVAFKKARKAANPKNTGKGKVVGTVPPQPFMRNALKKNQAKAVKDVESEVKKAVSTNNPLSGFAGFENYKRGTDGLLRPGK